MKRSMVAAEAAAALSSAQERLWFLALLEPASVSGYNVPFLLRLRGELDEAAAVRSVRAIVLRHEVLRTRIVEVDGRAVTVPEPETQGGRHPGGDRGTRRARRLRDERGPPPLRPVEPLPRLVAPARSGGACPSPSSRTISRATGGRSGS